jgi:hypothetical protein
MTVTLTKLNCPNCGAPFDWDGSYGKPITCPYCGSTFLPGPTDVDDLWLFTDPVARARFEFNSKLDELEHDIRYEVLRGGTWTALDRECKRELDRLEREDVIRKLASFWALSPFPPVYRAKQDGEATLGGKRFPFRKGHELVWACPMTRDKFELEYPILIGDFKSESVQRTCGEMAQAMMGRMDTMKEM